MLVLLLNKLKEPEVISKQGLLCHNARWVHTAFQGRTEGRKEIISREEIITLLHPRVFNQKHRKENAAESPSDKITDQGLKPAAVGEELEDELDFRENKPLLPGEGENSPMLGLHCCLWMSGCWQ